MSLARSPAEEDGVERTEEAGWRKVLGGRGFLEVEERARELLELRCDGGKARPDVSERETRPLGQVPVIRWPVACEVAASQLR